MLVLTRRQGEKIWVGDDVVVTVVGVHGSQVRIGIEAPPEVRVDREEVRERMNSGRASWSRTPALAGRYPR